MAMHPRAQGRMRMKMVLLFDDRRFATEDIPFYVLFAGV